MDSTHNDADGALIREEVEAMVAAEGDLSDDAKLIVLAALDSDEALASVLEGALPGSGGSPPATPEPSGAAPSPSGAFVKSIRVRGFRGIGPAATLDLRPVPGLTIVSGRNGSGKSSFSEALELALTGNTYRWNRQNSKQAAVWAQHWRNLHQSHPCELRIEVTEEGQGVTTVGVDWPQDGELTDRTTWVQRPGRQRETGVTTLGWDRTLELYQPILSYDELGGLLEAGPSKLFDKLDALLGMEQATDAEQRLATATKDLQADDTNAKAEARELKKVLAVLDDGRAQAALGHLRKHRPDLDAVEAIATGTTRQTASDLGALRALAQLRLPAEDHVAEVARSLREAAEAVAREQRSASEDADRRATLLREALEFHEHRGDGPCPVCGQGALDGAWRQRVEHELSSERERIERRRAAHRLLEQVRQQTHELLRAVHRPPDPGRFELVSYAEAVAAWQRWTQAPEPAAALADHLDTAYRDVQAAFELLRAEAGELLERREGLWVPHASRLAAWVGLARKAREKEATVRLVNAAREFMKTAVEQLRTRRLGGLKEAAREIWAALKQESNVNLGAIELKGSANRRRVELYADVDGAEAQALGVMSQGELHSLALALFLPRATMPGSPFRFVVLDDPIQAMDPAKVDSFVRILARLARERQVVVFSHDDRLPQAVRQLGVEAWILQVFRDGESSVTVSPCLDPAERFLQDAFAICKDEVPADVRSRVLPGLCRAAVEAAARDIYMTRRLSRGDARADVEESWQATSRTRQRIALAIHDDPQADLSRWRDATLRRKAAYSLVTRGLHGTLTTQPVDAVRSVERMVKDLRGGAR
ncbi:RecF/RecN/SMC family protein [Prauserella shujinwangii]|uniref:Nuclease SbcCD subunit C n=1 Tax=Prauserella shujinwangii TaxID=1453103 RepID=A0A2T0M2C5_9PSEU|nr:AAA family ATPase [Prauserella shujinwangii]PRX50870.1 RecF/RecN/SMC family protein [Prauserella shujinwangii]